MLVLLGKLRRRIKSGPGLGGLLGFQILVAAPAAHRGDDQNRASDDKNRIPVPQLFELLATHLLVDFIK